ncbi:MAG: hypothetical protein J6D18_03535 [Erysipelotrichaceae bacterium]|nr:hypothetical protein [Erysipelotrichaceae bacterium]
MKKIYCILGPSGSGKTGLARYCESRGIVELVSSTTRKPRPSEVEGKDYYFIDEKELNPDDFVECSFYGGIMHGLSKKEVQSKLDQYDEVCVVLDENGLKALKTLYSDQVVSIALDLDLETCIQRMRKRKYDPKDFKIRIDMYYERKEGLLKERCDYFIDASLTKEEMFKEFERIRNLFQGKGNSV